jgi:hypothetical protein
MFISRLVVIVSAAAIASGCASITGGVTEVPILIGALKCELNLFYKDYDGNGMNKRERADRQGFAIKDSPALGTLDLKLQVTNTEGASLAGATPSAISIALGVGAIYSNSATTDIKLVIEQSDDPKYPLSGCDKNGLIVESAPGGRVQVKIGDMRWSDWLKQFVASEAKLIAGSPKVQLQTLTLTSAITYTTTENAAVIALVPKLTGPSLTASQSDAETITLTLKGTAKQEKTPSDGEKVSSKNDAKVNARLNAIDNQLKELASKTGESTKQKTD